jgi:dihydrolipoamide dehydrogenase
MKITSELTVLGAGPGGYIAAFYAADLGKEVTLIDQEPNPGGVCLYRGCIPSKALLHIAKLIYEAKEAEKWGISFGKPEINLDKIRKFKENVVSKLTGGLGQLSKQRKINYIQGKGKFINDRELLVESANGEEIIVEFQNCIIATGSLAASIPAFNVDPDRIWNSRSALNLPVIPQKLLTIGGGYIGLELSTVYASLGSDVTVVEMLPNILNGVDRDLAIFLEKSLKNKLKAIYTNTKVSKVEKTANGVAVEFEGANVEPKVQEFDYVLVSVGRIPNSKNIGLENTKVQVNEKGFIIVNHSLKTHSERIWAIGDVVGNPMLAHKASAEGKIAVESILGKNAVFEPKAIPAVVYTDPEIAWAGITELEAKQNGLNIKIGKFPWAASGRATTMDRADGITKIIADAETDTVLGVGIAGPGAGELIAEGTLAIEMAANVADIALTIHPHPTLSETMMEAAESYFGHSPHFYKPKK